MLLALLAGPAGATGAVSASVVEQATAALCDKRIAVLGELPSHGEVRAFQYKAEIARALVERCGYQRLLFEAPVYDFLGLESGLAKGSATRRQLDNAIGRFWWARELADWRGWLFEHAQQGRLKLGGLDDQVSATSEHARAMLPGLVASKSGPRKAGACRAAVARHLDWSYDEQHPLDEAEQALLVECTGTAAAPEVDVGHAPVASVESIALGNFAGYIARQAGRKDAPERDAVMFRNTTWGGANPKTIVWTATVHGAKRQGELPRKPMGAWLSERWGDELGSIGFTALSGQSSMAGKPATALPMAPPDALEARLLAPALGEVLADAKTLAKLGAVESRLFGKFLRADWSTHFDGVVVIREEAPPSFEAPR